MKPADLDPGFADLLELNRLLSMKVRTQDRKTVLNALKEFFASKRETRTPVLDIQINPVLAALKHLQSTAAEEEALVLSNQELEVGLKALTRWQGGKQLEAYVEAAALLYNELKLRNEAWQSTQEEKQHGQHFQRHVLVPHLAVLGLCDRGQKARALLEELLDKSLLKNNSLDLWEPIVQAFARSGNREELQTTIALMEKSGFSLDKNFQQIVIKQYCEVNDIIGVKEWYNHPDYDSKELPVSTKTAVLQTCIMRGEYEWGQPILNELLEIDPGKEGWDLVFQWAAGSGKGVDAIEKMMTVMVRRSAEVNNSTSPDIHTINGLVRIANRRNDPYTAERFIALAERWQIEPNADTRMLQMEYRLGAGDMDGARHAYNELKGLEVLDGRDAPLINRMISILCRSKDYDYDAIMDYVQDLTDRKATFEAETIAALSLLHLKRNELYDVIDLLQTHAFHFRAGQRDQVRDAFVSFILDRSNTVTSAWDAYTILRQIFSEIDNELRVKCMQEFFARERCDMATHVFGHMRQSQVKEGRPTAETYTKCFEGIASLKDEECLNIVHNMLKLDSEVEPDTRLKNALMLAFLKCSLDALRGPDPRRSLDFWDDIVFSREGPTYNSICIALCACERAIDGKERAQDIWNRLKRFEVEITKEIYDAYIGALVGHCDMDAALELINKMEEETGSSPDVMTYVKHRVFVYCEDDGTDTNTFDRIANFCRGPPWDEVTPKLHEWAKTNYPDFWTEVEKSGKDETGRFKLRRPLSV